MSDISKSCSASETEIETPFPHFPSLPLTHDGSFNLLLPSLFAQRIKAFLFISFSSQAVSGVLKKHHQYTEFTLQTS